MLSLTDQELNKPQDKLDPQVTGTHKCQITQNYAGDETGTVATCACGQRWRLHSGFLFAKWQRI